MARSIVAPVDLAQLAARAAVPATGTGAAPSPLHGGCSDDARAMADAERVAQLLAELGAALAASGHGAAALQFALERRDDGRLRLSLTAAAAAPALQRWLAQSQAAWEAAGAEPGATWDATAPACWFDFRLAPALPTPADAGARATARPAGDARFRVLYIEDDPASRRLMATVLRRAPEVALVTAADGIEGLAQARESPPAAILTDINVPGLDGYGLLRELRRWPATAAVPVIAVSAEALDEDVERALAAGFHGYVFKPLKPDELVAALRSALPGAAG